MDHDFIKPHSAGSPPDNSREGNDERKDTSSDAPRSDWQKHVVREDQPSADEQPERSFSVPVTSSHASSDEPQRHVAPDTSSDWHHTPKVASFTDTPPVSSGSFHPQNTAVAAMPAAPFLPEQPAVSSSEVAPVAVVEVVSTRGVEYAMLTLTLWLGSFSLLAVLLALINGGTSFSALSFPASILIVCVPLFSFFFLRLKKAELLQPSLKLDPSKRRFTQFTQLIAFATCLFTVIAFVYLIMTKLSGQDNSSMTKATLDVLAVLAVAGGILAYYWIDEHRGK